MQCPFCSATCCAHGMPMFGGGATGKDTTRQMYSDPRTGRGWAYSTSGHSMNRPEFLFLDTPGNPHRQVSLSKIISDYEEPTTNGSNHYYPANLELVTIRPFRDDPKHSFVARRFVPSDYWVDSMDSSPSSSSLMERIKKDRVLQRLLERNFMKDRTTTVGIIVMIPLMRGKAFWEGGKRIPQVSATGNNNGAAFTVEDCDKWIVMALQKTGLYSSDDA